MVWGLLQHVCYDVMHLVVVMVVIVAMAVVCLVLVVVVVVAVASGGSYEKGGEKRLKE